MPGSLDGQVVLVSGVTAGIGRATADRLLASGATVVGCAREPDRLAAAGSELAALETVQCDVREADARAQLVAEVVKRHGRLDALVNSAGVGRIGWFADLESSDIDDVFATNATAYADLTRLALRHMLAAGRGHIVEIVSVAGWFATPPLTLYGASKHAVAGLIQGLRAELRGTGVLIHSIDPGPVATEFPARAVGREPDEDDPWVDQPNRFALDPGEVAGAVERCLLSGTSQTLTLPPIAAISRLAHVPVVGAAMERAIGAMAPQLVSFGQRLANKRVPPSYRARPKPRVDA
jgi:short-subunit dehydrogenase